MSLQERRREVEDVFRRTAEAVDGEYEDTAHWNRPTVQRRGGDWLVTLEWAPLDTGWYTFLRAPFHNPDRTRLAVRDEGLFDDLWKTLGFLQDIEVGDTAFDRRFLVKGQPAARVRGVLDDRARELMMAQPSIDLRVLGRQGAFQDPSYPKAVDELHYRKPGAVPEVDRLVDLFDLFLHLLSRLCPGAPTYARDRGALEQSLLAPGGTTRSSGGRLVFWDGDAPRRDAARRLGELGDPEAVPALLSVLDDPDDVLVARALEALAALGDPAAVPPVVRLLGRRRGEALGRSVAEHAGAALHAFGRGDLARAFDRAMEGRPESLKEAVDEERSEVVAALVEVLESGDLHDRPSAARALGTLGAAEALKALRDASVAMGMRTRLTEAASEAIREIESRASLPRPARSAPDAPDTHPRPAGGPGADRGTLPRPSAGGDDRSD